MGKKEAFWLLLVALLLSLYLLAVFIPHHLYLLLPL